MPVPSNAERSPVSPRARVLKAVRHEQPDRVPVDFLATEEVWNKLGQHLQPDLSSVGASEYFDPAREAVLRWLQVDCRVLSYDMFCQPPESALRKDATIEWWDVLSRSTPNRMWRQRTTTGDFYEIWGRHTRMVANPTGAYEELVSFPLQNATSINDLKRYPWPEPDWWDFTALPALLRQLDAHEQYHIRFRIGSVFEVAWQLRGMQEFLMDMAVEPDIPRYIMDRLTDVYIENTRRVLDLAGDRLDMLYFYDDVATQKSLMVSRDMWKDFIQPCHARLIEVVRAYGKPVMYHSDGAIYSLIPDLINMGIQVLNPIQADAKGMDPKLLKQEFGDKLTFHGGINITQTLPHGTTDEVRAEVRERVRVLGEGGGYILCSSHHIQSDTPLENVLAMYEIDLRF